MKPAPAPDFQALLEGLIDGSLSPKELVSLSELLQANSNLRRAALDHLALSEALSGLAPGRDPEAIVRAITEHVIHVAGGSDQLFVSQVIQRVSFRKRLLTAAAAVTFFAAGIFALRMAGLREQPMVAEFMELDAGGHIVTTSEVGQGFKGTLGAGLYRLDFKNGAIVAIEGPANFEVLSPTAMRLNGGQLNAWCPEPAHGFEVVTASGKVTDLGTAFGVSARPDGSADYMVMDGLVEVSAGKDVRRLPEGGALTSSGKAGLSETEFNPAIFTRTWPLSYGILATEGKVLPAPPSTSAQLAVLESNEAVMVIPEKRYVPFDKPFRAEMIAPGTFPDDDPDAGYTLQPIPGARLRSYLIRFNPVGAPGVFNGMFQGSVTFDRPVLAICAQKSFLDDTDATFAEPEWADSEKASSRFRGIDLDQPWTQPDRVRLSEDSRTVHILFNAGLSTDDIRVIVKEG
ncbi:hypothetical protein [Luteolibacter sp. LG18]|uniref:hypothetical protein n=1 Tax=Luteolibacter sp. LG18 TaxID=2819286 RepID=UPI002B2C47B4|nr:iron dicitrate transporter FecR [Luteolibacter sp. LG18]